MRVFLPVIASLALGAMSFAGVVGVFQGRIVRPTGTKPEAGILYIQARNGLARKVDISKAAVEYDEDFPAKDRRQDAKQALCAGTLVRITAEQTDAEQTDQDDGVWRVISIRIMQPPKTGAKSASGTKESRCVASMQASAQGNRKKPINLLQT